ncbi:adhesion G-protein coupled receptor D1-like [Dreissena polymorpha]|uniref:adhesion G-protein coupled receptor D1-like n=1 Tax=Dreissena polymorpha TaxID=45954 RepID=UPI002264FCE5|nr:adhesion G-protein coupled receptor D1-like [Dreissena polymorpha]
MFALKVMEDKPIKDKIKTTLWSLCVLVPLMGVSWILGIFYVNESASFMQYVFAVCNGLQGVYIFVCNCVLNEKVNVL